MAYNSVAALAFARKYWKRVCPDGFVGMANENPSFKKFDKNAKFELKQVVNPGEARDQLRLPDNSVIDGRSIDDCAHFISCCIGKPPGEQAGNIDVRSAWGAGIYGQTASDGLFHTLVEDEFGDLIGTEKMSHSAASAQIVNLKPGDLIFYHDPNHFGPNKPGYGHSAVYLGGTKRRIACHSYIRCDVEDLPGQEWDSVNITDVSFTFFKLS